MGSPDGDGSFLISYCEEPGEGRGPEDGSCWGEVDPQVRSRCRVRRRQLRRDLGRLLRDSRGYWENIAGARRDPAKVVLDGFGFTSGGSMEAAGRRRWPSAGRRASGSVWLDGTLSRPSGAPPHVAGVRLSIPGAVPRTMPRLGLCLPPRGRASNGSDLPRRLGRNSVDVVRCAQQTQAGGLQAQRGRGLPDTGTHGSAAAASAATPCGGRITRFPKSAPPEPYPSTLLSHRFFPGTITDANLVTGAGLQPLHASLASGIAARRPAGPGRDRDVRMRAAAISRQRNRAGARCEQAAETAAGQHGDRDSQGYKPANYEPGDPFPAPAPTPTGSESRCRRSTGRARAARGASTSSIVRPLWFQSVRSTAGGGRMH